METIDSAVLPIRPPRADYFLTSHGKSSSMNALAIRMADRAGEYPQAQPTTPETKVRTKNVGTLIDRMLESPLIPTPDLVRQPENKPRRAAAPRVSEGLRLFAYRAALSGVKVTFENHRPAETPLCEQ